MHLSNDHLIDVCMFFITIKVTLNLRCFIKVTCLDVTPGGLAASCDTDGHLVVWTTDNGELRVRLSVIHVDRYYYS